MDLDGKKISLNEVLDPELLAELRLGGPCGRCSTVETFSLLTVRDQHDKLEFAMPLCAGCADSFEKEFKHYEGVFDDN